MAVVGYSSYEAEKLTGLSNNTIRSLKNRGIAIPEQHGGWSLRQVVALKIMRDSRLQGASMAAALAAYELMRGAHALRLEKCFDAGRRYLVMFGESMILNLVTHERAFSQELKDDAIRQAVPLVIVDVETVFASIKGASDGFRRTRHNWRGRRMKAGC